jgi:hypothetical protein
MVTFNGVRKSLGKAAVSVKASFHGKWSGDFVVGRAHAVGCVVVCSFIALSFFVVTAAFADKVNDETKTAFLHLTMLRVDLLAAACKDDVPFDTAPIRQKLRQYSMDKKGFDYFESAAQKVDEMRADIASLPAADRQRQCMNDLRKSIRYYMEMRDLFMRGRRDVRVVPPPIDIGKMDMQ